LSTPHFPKNSGRSWASFRKGTTPKGLRCKLIELPGDVRVTVRIPYFQRQKNAAKMVAKLGQGLYPAMMLLGIVKRPKPHVRQRMVKAAALLGSYEEAAAMLTDASIVVSVNALREVCGHVGRRLAQLPSFGSVAVKGYVKGRRIVVSLDGARARLRDLVKVAPRRTARVFRPAGGSRSCSSSTRLMSMVAWSTASR
jgi:hypothetical protein